MKDIMLDRKNAIERQWNVHFVLDLHIACVLMEGYMHFENPCLKALNSELFVSHK